MNNNWRHSANTAVAQVWKATITTTTNGHTYIVTLTDDDGSTFAVTYTVVNPPDTTTTLVATGFIAAWNASTNPLVARITATQSAGQVILTADTAGIPFSAATSGTGTWSGVGNTTANVGNEDASLALNWSRDAALVATDDAIVEPGSVNVKYGLNQSAIAIADMRVMEGCSSQFGRFEFGKFQYFRIDPDLFDYRGNGNLACFDIGAAAIAAYIESHGQPSAAGRQAVYFKGTGVTILEIAKGVVGIAVLDGEVTTATTILVGLDENQASDANVTIGSGVTVTTITVFGGKCLIKCAATTVNVHGGAQVTTEGAGAITTLNAYPNSIVYPNSTGTITTVNPWGLVDASRDRSTRTWSTLAEKPGGKVIVHSGITISATTPLAEPGPWDKVYV